MIGSGFQALMPPLADIHWVLAHSELTAVLELLRILGNSYRLATSEVGSTLLYGRFAFHVCRSIVASVAP